MPEESGKPIEPVASPQMPNPLKPLHEQTDAEFQDYAGTEIVSTFGEPQAEYAAIHKGCALIDLPQRGLLELTGKDRLDFLNRFLTNQTVDPKNKTPLPAGKGVYAFLLNNKGRIVTDMNVIERGDRTFLELDARNVAMLRQTLEKFVFSEKVQFADRVGELHQIVMMGPKAAELLRRITPEAGGAHAAEGERPITVGAAAKDFSSLAPLGSAAVRLFDIDITLYRDDPAGVPGFYLICPADSAKDLWQNLLARFAAGPVGSIQPAKREIWPAGWAVFNTTRIEAGRPLFGIDFDDTLLPAETGQLARAVSFTKGCYLGQEIVARMHSRGQAARQIVGVRVEEDALPIAGAPIYDDKQNQVGGVTSSTISPILSNAAICLAIVKKPFIPVGTKLKVAAEGAIRNCVVAETPFTKVVEKKVSDTTTGEAKSPGPKSISETEAGNS
jgi:aminomethyltransferase